MSRFIKNAVAIPPGVEVSLDGGAVMMKGPAGEVRRVLHDSRLAIVREDNGLMVKLSAGADAQAAALAGTFWRVLAAMAHGCAQGFETALELVGVGYRAQLAGDKLTLSLGYSHPINYQLPPGVSAKAPSATEIILRAADKALLGQTAAEIRACRPPEPYKGKGVRYRGERIIIKETKKK